MIQSLSWQIIKRIVLVHIIAVVTLTAGQLFLNYREEMTALEERLESAHRIFGPLLGVAYFNADTTMIKRVENGILSDPLLVGVALYNPHSPLHETAGQLPLPPEELGKLLKKKNRNPFVRVEGSSLYGYQRPVFALDQDGFRRLFGMMFVFTDEQLIIDKITTSSFFVFLNSFAIVTILVAVVLLVFQRMALTPIKKFATEIDNLSFDEAGKQEVDLGLKERNEIVQLQDSFNELMKRLGTARDELNTFTEDLEKIVSERTLDLDLAAKKAMSASKAKSQFLASVSHEIRTPMNAILGLSHLALDRPQNIPTIGVDYFQKIEQAARSLLRIIEDVLDFSKIEADAVEPDNAPFRLPELVTEVSDLLAVVAGNKGIYLSVNIAEDVPRQVIGDEGRLRQVLFNLMGNAVKFTSEGYVETVVVLESVIDSAAMVRFDILDTGIGISAENQAKLFKPFSQVDASIARKYGGTGLGLAISSGLVELMGGEIQLESMENVGSTFSFSLRFETPSVDFETIASVTDYEESFYSTGREKILLVEDTDLNREIACEILTRKGLQVDTAEDGKQAIERVREKDYDLVLMDIEMPEMDGYEATRKIRMIAPDLPIIAMTAHAMKQHRQESLAAGMNAHLAKPIDARKLFKTLSQFLSLTAEAAEAAEAKKKNEEEAAVEFVVKGIDWTAGVKRFADNESLYMGFLLKFIDHGSKMVGEIESAVAAEDWPTVKRLAHSMRGSAAMVSAMSVSDAAHRLEGALELAKHDEITTEFDALTAEFKELIETTGKLSAEAKSNSA